MSLLNVTVKRAKYIGEQDITAAQFNTYVTLKLQNVKSTTVTVKGSEPCWEQDFLFETNNVNSGLLVEVWTKGMIWDRALGYQLIALDQISYSSVEQQGQWYQLDMELILMNGEVAGTRNPTGHMILLDCRFELPFDPDTQPGDLQRKLELLNGIMTTTQHHDRRHRQAQYLGNSGYSEDSDYTSDLNYPVGQNANSSASQYRNLITPPFTTNQRSFETSRENSYEKDDRLLYNNYDDNMTYGDSKDILNYSPMDDYQYSKDEMDPLSYNSRPMNSTYDKTYFPNSFAVAEDDVTVPQNMITATATITSGIRSARSLERQDTMYDDEYTSVTDPFIISDQQQSTYDDQQFTQNDDNYDDVVDAPSDYWDVGGGGGIGRSLSTNKVLPKIPTTADDIYYNQQQQQPPPPITLLPPTPSSSVITPPSTAISTKKSRLLPQPVKTIGSLPSTPRMLPQMPYRSSSSRRQTMLLKRSDTAESDQDSLHSGYSYRPGAVSAINYNEDYNYAYQSTDSLNQAYSDGFGGRRKGAALPTVPKVSKLSTAYTQPDDLSMYDDDYYAEDVDLPPQRKPKKLPQITGKLPMLPSSSSSNLSSGYHSDMRKKLPSIGGSNYYGTETDTTDYEYNSVDVSFYDTYATTNYFLTSTVAPSTDHSDTTSTKYLDDSTSYYGTSSATLPSSGVLPQPPPTSSSSSYQPAITTNSNYYNNSGDLYSSINLSNNKPTSVLATTAAAATTTAAPPTTKSTTLYGISLNFNYNSLDTAKTHAESNEYFYGSQQPAQKPALQPPTQSSSIGITSITKTLSSIFQSKPPAATTQQPQKPFLPNKMAAAVAPTTTATTDYFNNYCDDEYYSNISGITTSTMPCVSVPANDNGYGGSGTTTGDVTGTTTTGATTNLNNSLVINCSSSGGGGGNVVDYSSDDYKYNYDDYSYSENDYIATGDIITNKNNNYNNNYDMDYFDDDQHQQQIDSNNKNLYCDNSSSLLIMQNDKTVVMGTAAAASSTTTTTITGNVVPVSQYGNEFDQPISLNSSSLGLNNFINNYTTTTTAATTVLPPTTNGYYNRKNGVQKQQTLDLYDEDEIVGSGTNEEEYDEYYQTTTTAYDGTTDYYSTAATTMTTTTGNYNYQEDYFNEEDEYKYLEKERDEANLSNGHHHDDQQLDDDTGAQDYDEPPLDGAADEIDPLKLMKKPTKKHLAAQDSIDDNEFFLQHSKNMLTLQSKQDSIQEEDETLYPASPQQEFVTNDFAIVSTAAAAAISITATSSTTAASLLTSTMLPTGIGAGLSGLAGIGATKTVASTIAAAATSTIKSSLTTINDHHLHKDLNGLLQSSNTIVADNKLLISDDEKKKLQRGETEELLQVNGTGGAGVAGAGGMRKSEITAKQRWNWAYNKIIMQLNNSRPV